MLFFTCIKLVVRVVVVVVVCVCVCVITCIKWRILIIIYVIPANLGICVVFDLSTEQHIPEQQRNYLKLLWWKDSNLGKDVEDHKMPAHVFGGAYSPLCSNYAQKKIASDNIKKYGDDYLKAKLLCWRHSEEFIFN